MGNPDSISSKLVKLYDCTVLGSPRLTLLCIAIIFCAIISYINQFRLDASSDTLLLENDTSLEYYRAISAAYESDDNLIITYTPKTPLFTDGVIDDLKQLHYELASIKRVESITSLINVPLLESPPVNISDIEKEVVTLENPIAQHDLAQKEFLNSPLYRNLLISPDGKTTALMVQFKRDSTWHKLLKERNDLRKLAIERELSAKENKSLVQAETQFNTHSKSLQKQIDIDIEAVRAILNKHRDNATLYLGGVPMITSDSINFVRSDLATFGAGVFALLVLILTIIFNRPRWVFMAMTTCVIAGVSMVGLLGLINWPVTVVSSNFISLMLILTLSLLVHLIVRYRELLAKNPNANQRELLLATVQSKFIPSLYTALTTMVAFGSLVISNIRPIIDFGWMMVFGLTISMILAFTIFPAALALLKREKNVKENNIALAIPRFFVHSDESHSGFIMISFCILIILSIIGISKLTVENRFIDYYKSSTEIYQGMEMIDRQLGGTTPLEIIIDAPDSFFAKDDVTEEDVDSELDDLFDDEDMEGEAGITGTSYWFNSFTLQQIANIHDYLDSLDETGKVLSLTTTLRMLKKLDSEILEDDFALALLYKRLPTEMKALLIDPYLSPDGNQLRFSIRVFESDPSLRREELLKKIRYHLTHELGLEDNQVKITGMLVLYNNMLQSLFQSQILTIGVVFVAILLMFIVLFRNPFMAIIALIPNLLSAAIVLGIMGWFRIPLDIMTITIAAICIGIAVDNTIHYVYRFSEEFGNCGNYWEAVRRSHETIGCAMYYTTITIALGFSILAFSNFIPTIYFGLLTGFSMIAALIANLTLLPVLIVRLKPLGKSKI